jgi:hypothetical protein
MVGSICKSWRQYSAGTQTLNFLYELVANPSGTWAAASMPTRIVGISLSVALIYMIASAIVRAATTRR